MSDHTPGPWYWGDGWTSGKREKYMDFRLIGGNGDAIIPIRVDHHEPMWDSDPMESWAGMTSDADRHLIAAAPDLLEALEKTAKALERYDLGHPLIADANIALAKANTGNLTDLDERDD